MNPRLRKIWGDLRESPTRTLLVGLAIMVGTTALTAVFTARTILLREVEASFQSSKPAAVVFQLNSVDAQLLEEIRTFPNFSDADARRIVRARAEVAPDDWRTLVIFGVRDFEDLRVSTFQPANGDFPPDSGEILVEQSSLSVLKTETGGNLRVRVSGGKTAELPVGGTVHDAGLAPGWQDNSGYAYASTATLEMLGQGSHLDELRIALRENVSRAEAIEIAVGLTEWLKSTGRTIDRVEVPLLRHPHADQMNTLLLLLLIFSLLALALSGALTANVMAALMAKQTRQIGVMKAVGASSRQVAEIYLGGVLLIAVLAVIIGIPPGAIAGRAYSAFAAEQLNLIVTSQSIPIWFYSIIALAGIGVPLLAALIPILRATRKPAREALQDSGIQTPTASNRNATFLTKFLIDDRRMTLALRNTFRRPVRTWLSLGALALGGAMLLAGANVYASLVHAVDAAMERRGDDLDVRLLRPAMNKNELVNQVKQIPGVKAVEAWGNALVSFGLSGNQNQIVGTNRYSLLAPPADSKMLQPKIIEGRWLEQTEEGAIVVNRILRDTEENLKVGENLNLIFAGKPTSVRVVGVTEEISEPGIYTNAATMQNVTSFPPEGAGALRLAIEPGQENQSAAVLEQTLADNGLLPVFLMTRQTLRQSMTDHFVILLFVLTALSLSALAVGSFGLATTMSLNVLERQREIGIIRAVGATPNNVFQIILVEAFAIAAASIYLAIIVSLPLSWLINLVIGNHGLHSELPFDVSPAAIFVWVFLALILTFLASSFPAWRTIRLSVRDTLSYE